MWIEEAKKRAALEAVKYIKNGDTVGLGSGTTAAYVVNEIGRLIKENKLRIFGIPTSSQARDLAVSQGIPLTTLDSHPKPDLAIDGADQVDRKLNMIKGLGGALTREKIVDRATKKFIVVIDETKLTDKLGLNQPIPLEVLPFALSTVSNELGKFNGKSVLRTTKNGSPLITDNGNYIIDLYLNEITRPKTLDRALKSIPGIIETGLFIGMADIVYVGYSDGSVKKLTKY